MGVVLEAMDAPRPVRVAARILGMAFRMAWLRGDLSMHRPGPCPDGVGPAYIKFGQILSTRPDVIGADLAKQLQVAGSIAAVPHRSAAMIETEWNGRSTSLFIRVLGAGRRGVHRAGAPRDPLERTGDGSPSRSCGRGGAGVSKGYRRVLPDRLGDRDALALLPPPAPARGHRGISRASFCKNWTCGSRPRPRASFLPTRKRTPGSTVPQVEWFLSSRRMMTWPGPTAFQCPISTPSMPPATTESSWRNASCRCS
jgi:ubiquinone biosynthesis protein